MSIQAMQNGGFTRMVDGTAAAAQTNSMDAFAQVILNMISGMQENIGQENTDATAQLRQMSESELEMLEGMPEEDDTDAQNAAMELVAMMLQTAETLPDTVQTTANTVAAMSQMSIAEMTQNMHAAAQPQVQELQAQTELQPDAVSVVPDAPSEVPTDAKPEIIEVSSAQAQHTQNDSGESDLFYLQSNFRNAVSATKSKLEEDNTDFAAELLDVDALQRQIQTNHDLTVRFTAVAEPQAETPVAQQIETGLTENLELGKTEFKLKLHPEDLGEVTIHLTEKDGKTTLHLYTANATAAKAINDEIAALREAVKPMAVEVHDAVVEINQNETASGFEAGNQFAQQQQQQQWQQSSQHRNTAFAQELLADEEIPAEQILAEDGLDTYV